MTKSERELISRIRSQTKIDTDRLILGIGDDCAVYHLSESRNESKFGIITTDALVESIHFDLSWHPAKLLGRKSLAVNLSDIAAMGGRSLFALLTIGIPDDAEQGVVDDFMAGFQDALNEYGVLLIGGDTVKSASFVISVTVIGEVEKEQVLYRSGAKDGDLIWVSGSLGHAAAGLEICRRGKRVSDTYKPLVEAHLNPVPRVSLGQLLAASGLVNAMMDISDGIATDLAHICNESEVRAEIESDTVPISNEFRRTADELGCSVMDWVLKGGEDYELLFTSPAGCYEQLQKMVRKKSELNIHCIGQIKEGEGVYIDNSGKQQKIDFEGYDHFVI